MRILYAATEPTDLEIALGGAGFNVYSTDSADEAIDLGKLYDYDLILLADITGAHRVLQELRAAKCKTPILRLSADGDAIAALNAGADDYMRLPAHAPELVARVHAIVRRSKGHAASLVTVGSLTLNLDTKTVTVAGQRVHLTGKEYQMLELLGLRAGSLITKEMFLNHLYGGMDEPEMKIIDVFICKLRKKLSGVEGGEGLIETVWGRGYLLVAASGAEEASLAPEMRDMIDDPPVHVTRRSPQEAQSVEARRRFVASPSLVPALGQK